MGTPPCRSSNHLVERMHDRNISLEDLNQLRLWMESNQDVPDGAWLEKSKERELPRKFTGYFLPRRFTGYYPVDLRGTTP